MCDKHARSGLLGSLLLSVAILFSNSSGGHGETINQRGIQMPPRKNAGAS